MISLHRLGVRFGGLVALDEVTAELRAPVVGLIGPNGAGKSSLLDALSGLVPVQPATRLLLDQLPLHPLSPRQRALAGLRRAFQHDALVPERSVADNVAVALDARPGSRADKAAALQQALQGADLWPLREAPCGRLDRFERRRVAWARALAGGARLLLLDEPAAGLPPHQRAALAAWLERVHADTGTQTLLVEHDLRLVARCCEEVLVLQQGRLLAHGPTAQVLADARVRAACAGAGATL
ncbi:ATP-binding cassette domain-containing protein [uncultured Aquincola sp.]|uniref:ATP-binding cassette domain-containing protein n=1 Tax=uncultured Aquincola sp. TaxID=886556 RepID=UPI0032B277F8